MRISPASDKTSCQPATGDLQ